MTTILTPTSGGGGPITTIAELNNVIVQADNAGRGAAGDLPAGAYEIDLGADANIALTSALEAINLASGVTLDIEGDRATLDRANSQGVDVCPESRMTSLQAIQRRVTARAGVKTPSEQKADPCAASSIRPAQRRRQAGRKTSSSPATWGWRL
jgi:hypothetical protein